MVEMLDGLELWTAEGIAQAFRFGVKRKKNSPLYRKLLEIQSKATNPSQLFFPGRDVPNDRELYDWEENYIERCWYYNPENDDKAKQWWHLLTDDEQAFLNEEYKIVCRSYYENEPIDEEGNPNLNLEFRYRFNPLWEAFKADIANRPKVESFKIIDHGLVGTDFDCDCCSKDDGFKHCEWDDGDTPDDAISVILRTLKDQASIKASYENEYGKLSKESSEMLFPLIDFFDLSHRLRDHFGERACEVAGDQFQDWTLDIEPSGVAETLRQAGWEKEPDEPNRDAFDSDEAFENALNAFEDYWNEWFEVERNPQFKYRICLKFNVARDVERLSEDS